MLYVDLPDAVTCCTNLDSEGDRCQLVPAHTGPHVAAADGTYLTWQHGEEHRWNRNSAPAWLTGRPWAPGFGYPG